MRIFVPPEASEAALGLQNLAIQHILDGGFIEQQRIPAWRLMYFHDATRLTINDSTTDETAGTFVIFSPESTSAYRGSNSTLRHSWVRASGDLPGQWARDNELPIDRPMRVGPQMDPTPWLTLMMREVNLLPGGPNLALSSLLRGWLSQVARCRDAGEPVSDRLIQARSAIEATCLSPRHLADYAATAGMSESRFCQAFSSAFRSSPIQYRNFCRLEHARELLESTRLRVSEIARRCGFADAFHFSKSFKKHTGQSPRSYRGGGSS